MKIFISLAVPLVLLVGASPASGQGPSTPVSQALPAGSKIDPGDTACALVSAALVMLMTPGLGLTFLLLKLLDATMGLKVNAEDEESGLDLSQHNETGYNI